MTQFHFSNFDLPSSSAPLRNTLLPKLLSGELTIGTA